ncbi:MAG: hypothetical protein AAF632_24110 [Bacteroidota bacterium]
MPNARVICAKPRTITRILPFDLLEDGIEKIALSGITQLTLKPFFDEIIESSKAFQCVEKEVELSDGRRIILDGERNYIDGVLQDQITGELFYFLAINKVRKLNVKQIDEGSVVEYEKEYKGIAEINLYKGNSGHRSAREELLKKNGLLRKVKSIKSSKQVAQETKVLAEKIMEQINQLEENDCLEPIPIGTEIVRYVEVRSVKSII